MVSALAYPFRMQRSLHRLLLLAGAATLLAACQTGPVREPTAAVAQDVDPLAKSYTQLGLRQGAHHAKHPATKKAPWFS